MIFPARWYRVGGLRAVRGTLAALLLAGAMVPTPGLLAQNGESAPAASASDESASSTVTPVQTAIASSDTNSSPSGIPTAIKTMIAQKKYNDAAIALSTLIDQTPDKDRLPFIKVLLATDPDAARLVGSLKKWLATAQDGTLQVELVRNLGQLLILQRDFRAAASTYDQGGPVAEFQLASGRLNLLLGNPEEARARLVAVLSGSDKSLIEPAACGLAWLFWSQGDAKKAYEIIKNQTGPAALSLQVLIARSLGKAKDELAAIERLRSSWPHSVWYGLVDDDHDPALQMDSVLMVLTGIGPGAGGSVKPGTTADPIVGSTAPVATKSNNPTAGDDTAPKGIQVGTFKSAANAKKLADKLKAKGFMAVVEAEKGSSPRWKVTVLVRPGQDSQTLVVQLKDLGIEGFLVF